MLGLFYDTNVFAIDGEGNFTLELVSERMRGEVAAFDIEVDGKVIVDNDGVHDGGEVIVGPGLCREP